MPLPFAPSGLDTTARHGIQTYLEANPEARLEGGGPDKPDHRRNLFDHYPVADLDLHPVLVQALVRHHPRLGRTGEKGTVGSRETSDRPRLPWIRFPSADGFDRCEL